MPKFIPFITLLFTIFLANMMDAQKKVTYGSTTFPLYQPQTDLLPTPLCGFKPDIPGYKIKSKNYGPGTYYAYAPGNVLPTKYQNILTEIRDWVGHRPEKVKELAAQKGLVALQEKTIAKMFQNTRLPNGGLMYQLSEKSWIWFYIVELANCGKANWSSHEPYVIEVKYIEKVPQDAAIVLDKLYRFWNDGAHFADYAGITQSNFKTQPTTPNDQNPNHFAIGDVLNRKKGFYVLSFAGGFPPTYVWHSYEKVVAANLLKPDFDATGEIGFNDLLTAFEYGLDAVKVGGKDLYISYRVSSRFLLDLQPGRTWQKEMAERKSFDAASKKAMQQVQKANEKSLEALYKEIFR